jgi:hypothetical protein
MKAEITEIIRKAKKFIQQNYPDLDFSYSLIGSGGKNLITR